MSGVDDCSVFLRKALKKVGRFAAEKLKKKLLKNWPLRKSLKKNNTKIHENHLKTLKKSPLRGEKNLKISMIFLKKIAASRRKA